MTGTISLDDAGEGYVSFMIPSYIKQDVMSLVLTLKEGSSSENSVHSVSLTQVSKIFIKFTPESTDL